MITSAIVPLLLFSAFLVLAAQCFRLFAPQRLTYIALVVAVTDIAIFVQFRPQHIDHHNWQVLMAMGMFYAALRPAHWRNGVLGGICAATYLAISLEGLPLVALFAGIAAITWLRTNAVNDGRRLVGFLCSLAFSATALQILTRGPASIWGQWCDSLSEPYLGAFAIAAIGVAAVMVVSERFRLSVLWRTALLGTVGISAVVAMVAITPACSKGPFVALDPIVQKYWYNLIAEGMPVWHSGFSLAWLMIAPSIIGLIGSILAYRASSTPDQRRLWAITMAAILGALPVQIMVLRFGATAHIFALPGTAWLIMTTWAYARSRPKALSRITVTTLVPCLSPLLLQTLPPLALFTAFPSIDSTRAEDSQKFDETTQCMDAPGIAALNRLPTQTLLTPLDMASGILFHTQHSVTGTGHHRNADVMSVILRAFTSPSQDSEPLVRQVGGSTIVLCPNTRDVAAFARVPGDTLTRALLAGQPPAWLQPVDLGPGVTLKAWRVMPATGGPSHSRQPQ